MAIVGIQVGRDRSRMTPGASRSASRRSTPGGRARRCPTRRFSHLGTAFCVIFKQFVNRRIVSEQVGCRAQRHRWRLTKCLSLRCQANTNEFPLIIGPACFGIRPLAELRPARGRPRRSPPSGESRGGPSLIAADESLAPKQTYHMVNCLPTPLSGSLYAAAMTSRYTKAL